MTDVKNITSSNPGRNGVMFRAPIGTDLPTNAVSELNKAFKDLGIVGEDGVTQAITRDTEDIKAYGGDIVYTVQTDFGEEFTMVLYESRNADTLKAVFGDDNVVVGNDGTLTVKHNKAKLPRSSFVFDHEIDQGVKRQVMEIGQIVSVGDIVNVHSDIVKYELTVKAFPNADGNVLVEYIGGDTESNALQLSTEVLKAATQNEAYTANIVASGGKSPYTFEVIGEPLAGLTLSAQGVLSGTPTGTGAQRITVKVIDANKKSAQKTLTLQINPAAGG